MHTYWLALPSVTEGWRRMRAVLTSPLRCACRVLERDLWANDPFLSSLAASLSRDSGANSRGSDSVLRSLAGLSSAASSSGGRTSAGSSGNSSKSRRLADKRQLVADVGMWMVQFGDLQLKKLIGRGSFGRVSAPALLPPHKPVRGPPGLVCVSPGTPSVAPSNANL